MPLMCRLEGSHVDFALEMHGRVRQDLAVLQQPYLDDRLVSTQADGLHDALGI